MSMKWVWPVIFLATFSIDRTNAIEVACFSMGVLATLGLHAAIENLLDLAHGPVETERFINRVVPAFVVLVAMVACVSLVHLNFSVDSQAATGHAITESLKTLVVFAAIRYKK